MCIKIQRKKWNMVTVLGWLFYLDVARHKWRCASEGFQLALTLPCSERKRGRQREMQKHRTFFSSSLSTHLFSNFCPAADQQWPRHTTTCRGNSLPLTASPAVLVILLWQLDIMTSQIFPESSDVSTYSSASRGDFPLIPQLLFWTFFPHHHLQLCEILCL